MNLPQHMDYVRFDASACLGLFVGSTLGGAPRFAGSFFSRIAFAGRTGFLI
jgi:hypothetical protein